MLETHLAKAKDFLECANPDIQKTGFGYAIIKGNWVPSKSVDNIEICGHSIDLNDWVLHERVLVIYRDSIGLRCHKEEYLEVVKNIGDTSIAVRDAGPSVGSASECGIRSGEVKLIKVCDGFLHGFFLYSNWGELPEEAVLLYVAKALKPEFVEGNSFRMPKSTYRS